LVPPGSWRLPEELFDNIEITNTNRKPACWRTAENQGTKFKKYVVVVIHPAAKAAGILTTRQLNFIRQMPGTPREGRQSSLKSKPRRTN